MEGEELRLALGARRGLLRSALVALRPMAARRFIEPPSLYTSAQASQIRPIAPWPLRRKADIRPLK